MGRCARPKFRNAVQNRCEICCGQTRLVEFDEFYFPILETATAKESLGNIAA